MKLNIAFSLIILSLVILFIYGIKRNNNFINIFKIVTVLINIILVFFMLIYVAINNSIFRTIFTAIISYILLVTFLTIMIIIKRIRILFKQDN